MTYFDLTRGCAECPPPGAPTAVALGLFDGVHIGHTALLREAVRLRDALCAGGVPAVAAVWSLFEQPKNLLPDKRYAPVLTALEEKLGLLASLGLDYAALEHFDDVRGTTAEAFVRTTLLGTLDCRAAVCGFNFRFGAGGRGDADQLCWLCSEAGVPVSVMPPVMRRSRVVSSSAIRLLIENGETEEAAELLGRPFFINFPVVYGKQLGRRIGIPTINQSFPAGHIVPGRGIYAVTVDVGGDLFLGVTNIGCRPTVDGENAAVNSETHIVNYNGLLYGKRIRVSFYRRLRDERRFSSVEELRGQIARDIEAARLYFSTR